MANSVTPPQARVRIGQAARFAGVTVKTIRHYHRMGAVPEPERDSSGYRCYTSSDLLHLMQARTLAEAGVTIADIGGLLAGTDDALHDAVTRVDRELAARIAELTRRRDRLRRLRDPDRACLPSEAADMLARMSELGFDPAFVDAQREACVLACAMAPEQFPVFVHQMRSRLADPEAVALMKTSWEATSWDADDPRLGGLATAIAENLLRHPGHLELPSDLDALPEGRLRTDIVNHHKGAELPTSVVLTRLIEDRLREAGFPVPYSS